MRKAWSWLVLAVVVMIAALVMPSTASAQLTGGHWEKIAERTVNFNGKVDVDTIPVGAGAGIYKALQIKVANDDLIVLEMKVLFGNGTTWNAPVNRVIFNKDQRSKIIDLPGDIRIIQAVQFKYADRPGGATARLELHGYDTTVRLGSQTVNGKGDWDSFPVSSSGQYRYLVLNVRNSAMKVEALRITFADGGAPVTLSGLPQTFSIGQSRVLDLPGNARAIKRIELKYSDLDTSDRRTPLLEIFGVP